MQLRGTGRPSRQDEVLEWREIAFHRVDGALEVFDANHFDAGKAAGAGAREMRADLEKIVLDLIEGAVGLGRNRRRAGDADEGVELVDGAVGLDARVVFRDARSAE